MHADTNYPSCLRTSGRPTSISSTTTRSRHSSTASVSPGLTSPASQQLAISSDSSDTQTEPTGSTSPPRLPIDRFNQGKAHVVLPQTPKRPEKIAQTPRAPFKPLIDLDTSPDNSFASSSTTPTRSPARASSSRSTPTQQTTAMPPLPSRSPSSSLAPTIEIPETPLLDQPLLQPSSTQADLQTQIARLRTQRNEMTAQLTTLTTCIDHLRLRQRITQLDAVRERLEAQQAMAKAEADRRGRAWESRRRGWWKIASWCVVVGVLVWGVCGVLMAPEVRYVRGLRCRNLGLPRDC